jgi:NADH:ubiquinone oxidoreductase subunit 4 (subunit M)
VPLTAVIVALGVYPNFVVDRTEKDVARSIVKARDAGAQAAARSERGNLALPVLAEEVP